jgi:BRCA1-associated protein
LSLELATGRVWDYVEDVFVHSMSSQEMASALARGGGREAGEGREEEEEGEHGGGGGGGGGGEARGGGGGGKDPQGKLDGLGAEYSALLMSQLEEQHMYYERLLAKTAAELAQSSCQDDQLSEQERKDATQARAQIVRLEEEHTKLMTALREAEEEARQMRGRNQGLLQDQRQQMDALKSARKAIEETKAVVEAEVTDLQSQISDLAFFLRTQSQVQESSELAGGGLLIQQTNTDTSANRRGRGGRRRRGGT